MVVTTAGMQVKTSLFLMGRPKPSLGYSVLTHIRARAAEMPFRIQTSCALLVRIDQIMKLFVFCLLITSQDSLPSPRCVCLFSLFILSWTSQCHLTVQGQTPGESMIQSKGVNFARRSSQNISRTILMTTRHMSCNRWL
jgi:hypothetical protein